MDYIDKMNARRKHETAKFTSLPFLINLRDCSCDADINKMLWPQDLLLDVSIAVCLEKYRYTLLTS